MFDKDGKLDERSQRILSEQTIPPSYGVSPGMQALADLKAFNALPLDVQMKAASDYVSKRLSNPNDEWWPT